MPFHAPLVPVVPGFHHPLPLPVAETEMHWSAQAYHQMAMPSIMLAHSHNTLWIQVHMHGMCSFPSCPVGTAHPPCSGPPEHPIPHACLQSNIVPKVCPHHILDTHVHSVCVRCQVKHKLSRICGWKVIQFTVDLVHTNTRHCRLVHNVTCLNLPVCWWTSGKAKVVKVPVPVPSVPFPSIHPRITKWLTYMLILPILDGESDGHIVHQKSIHHPKLWGILNPSTPFLLHLLM